MNSLVVSITAFIILEPKNSRFQEMFSSMKENFLMQDMLWDTVRRFFPLRIALKIMLIEEHESEEVEQENENAAPIVYDEIVVEPPPPNPPAETPAPPPKHPNRRTRRMIARAFKAVVKG